MADTPVVPDGDLYRKAAQFAERALARERAAEAALDAAWQTVRGDALAAQEALLERVSKAREAGTRTSPAWAYQQARLGAVLAEADAALAQFGTAAAGVVTEAQEAAQRAALEDAASLVTEAAQEAVVGASFVPSQAGAVAAATGFLEDGTPLADLFRQVGAEALADGRAAITTGLALGKSPAWIARRFTKAMDLAPARARTIARTEALRVHRQVSSDTYAANADVLEGWVWTAALDSRSCTACIAMHGTIHGLDERLDGHPNCRCRMVPRTLPWDQLAGRPTGAEDTRPAPVDGVEWFEGQPDSVKRQVLGPAKYAAYKRGDITLEDTVARTSSQRWGSMRRERSLDEIRRGKNANAPRRLPSTAPHALDPEQIARQAAEAKQAALTKKWLGKPAPKAPVAPTPPATIGEAAFTEWTAKAKARYAAHAKATGSSKTDLEQSLNWSQFRNVIENGDQHALGALLREHYLDDDLYDEGMAAIIKSREMLPGAAEAYRKALRAYKGNLTRHKRYAQEWREVNGVTGPALSGMDDAVRHASDDEGVRWADANLHVAGPGTPARSAIREYTGSSYDPWNRALREHADSDGLPSAWAAKTTAADGAFAGAPEAVVLNRGTNWDEFLIGGKRSRSLPPPPPTDLIGTAHTQWGYASTSVGRTAAFGSNPVQLKIKVPEGHGVTWAQPYSSFASEREVLLERGTIYYVHDVYQDNGKWIVEIEALPPGTDVATVVGSPRPASARFRDG